jgi:anaerobic selenocysteine-containing dehydrogenase
VYARIGTCTVEFGTLTTWLVDVINALTGNLDRPGGVMWPLAAHQRRGDGKSGRAFTTGRFHSRVRKLPEVAGELPAATMAEEIETPGDGQIRAMVTVAGNPVLSTPNSTRLDAAFANLEFMVSVDPYLNETTRHAHVILPPTDSSQVGDYAFNFFTMSIRNTVTYSPPVFAREPGAMDDCEILARLTLIARGKGADADPAEIDEELLAGALERAAAGERDPGDLRAMVTGDHPAERILDVMVRSGAYGDGFGTNPDGLALAGLLDAPHGIDLGPLEPRIPEVLRTPSGKIELCPPAIAADVERLRAALDRSHDGLLLVGRRHLRSNNSWLHNVEVLVKGKERCTLQIHPDDAARLGVADGAAASVTSRVGTLTATAEVTDEVMAGVVSLPHGWGHDAPGTRMAVAAAHAGVNSNVLTDEAAMDVPSGNAVLNGIPVTVSPAFL